MRRIVLWFSNFLTKASPYILAVIAIFIMADFVKGQERAELKAEELSVIVGQFKDVLCKDTPVNECNLEAALKRLEKKIDENSNLTNCLLLAHGQLINGGAISEEDKKKCTEIIHEAEMQSTSTSQPSSDKNQNISKQANNNTKPKNNQTNNPPRGNQGLVSGLLEELFSNVR